MKQILIMAMVAMGGAKGSVLRYYLGLWLNGFGLSAYYWGTLAANVLACFVLGCLAGLSLASVATQLASAKSWYWLLLATGLCGGLSTFSTLMLEVSGIQTKGDTAVNAGINLSAGHLGYLLMSVLVGLLALWLGLKFGQRMVPIFLQD